jgi:hypothetical protein
MVEPAYMQKADRILARLQRNPLTRTDFPLIAQKILFQELRGWDQIEESTDDPTRHQHTAI